MKARENPFASWRIDRLAFRLPGITWDEVIARLSQLGWRGAVVGPKGSGKTTFLDSLEPQLAERGFDVLRLRLDDQCRRLESNHRSELKEANTHRRCILLDGAEQLGWWSWQRFLGRTRAVAGLVITTHRSGRLPLLLRCETTPELLAELAGELLGEDPTSVLLEARARFERHRGNLREAFRDWYDHFSNRSTSPSSSS